ncbi:MAG: hypothetical protein WD423_14730 [Rhodothermales bacterium]
MTPRQSIRCLIVVILTWALTALAGRPSAAQTAVPIHPTEDAPATLPELPFHLTARPWQPLDISAEAYLDALEGACTVVAQHQDERGAIIDPYLDREHQYSTPYFAIAVGALLDADRGEALHEPGIRAMEHATARFAEGSEGIPDAHGEFFIAALTEALHLYEDEVDAATYDRWHERLETPLGTIMRDFTGRINNWRTYAMKGEWMRAQAGLVDRQEAYEIIEREWNEKTQRTRILTDKWNLYQDWSSDPQSHAVEAVGRGNLIGLIAHGYDGPSAEEIDVAIRRGTRTSLLLQAPDGQAPTNGRTDNHVFNDVLYQLAFEVFAEQALAEGDTYLAGQYRRAALMAFDSIQRWVRDDEPWAGSFYLTKNRFEPGDRVGYQPASQWGNYTGAVIMHLAEAYLARQSDIEEQPTPTEIGGYAFSTDARFSTFFANAGGMQIQANLRGASVPKYGISWTPLGVVRFVRADWDGRLGPSDGEHDRDAGEALSFSRGAGETADAYRAGSGVTFGPTWREHDRWVRIADLHTHYRATPEVHFVHPLLVRFSLTYSYVTGRGGPYFRQDFVVTPDGVLSRLVSPQDDPFALTVPILEDDGRALDVSIGDHIASTRYAPGEDQQNFIGLNADARMLDEAPSIQSSYGWLKPVRYESADRAKEVFVYPRSPDDPSAADVRESFQIDGDDFSSILGRVEGTMYVGRTSAGGEGDRIDLDGDGSADVSFSASCRFVLQLRDGVVTAVESDRAVTMELDGESYQLSAHTPVDLTP